MENKYISVQELATQLNISTQAIYKKMKNEFKPYVKLIKGRKMIDISVFAAIDKKNFKPDWFCINYHYWWERVFAPWLPSGGNVSRGANAND